MTCDSFWTASTSTVFIIKLLRSAKRIVEFMNNRPFKKIASVEKKIFWFFLLIKFVKYSRHDYQERSELTG